MGISWAPAVLSDKSRSAVVPGSLWKAGPTLLVSRHRHAIGPKRNRLGPVQSEPAGATLWVQTTDKGAFTTALESGVDTFAFSHDAVELVQSWQQLARMHALALPKDGSTDICQLDTGDKVGQLVTIVEASDVQKAAELRNAPGYVVVAPADWHIIPAENLVAAFQSGTGKLLMVAGSCKEAVNMLEALEKGVHGVLLRTQAASEVRTLAQYMAERVSSGTKLQYTSAKVVRVESVGPGDRVCVDLCSNMGPGEGLLVGSFARALFLVHSESAQSAYISSRPFRVNAGAVHSYVAVPQGKTAYLSEVVSGAPALIADHAGATRRAVVGRAKVERRSLVLVEAETPDGIRHSVLLQNAETVRLIGPGATGSGPSREEQEWQALPVSQIAEGDSVWVRLQGAARHTGIAITESISEK